MRKILAAVVVLAGSAAFAQVDATEVGPAVKQEAKNIGSSAQQNAQELGRQAGFATEDQGTFKSAQAFNMKGTLQDAGKEEVTVQRKNLPPAVLDVRDQTAVYINGKKADASELKDGMDVKAKFQLEGEETVAVRIDAKETAMGGSGTAGKKVNKAEKKTDAKADQMKKDTKKSVNKAGDQAKDTANDVQDDANDAVNNNQ